MQQQTKESTPLAAEVMAAAAAGDTKSALVAAAIEILGSDGWSALRMRDLAKVVGIRAPSIYHHFATKTDLGLAVIAHLRQEGQHYCDMVREAGSSLRQRMAQLLQCINECDAADTSCPLYILQAEFAALPEPMQHEVQGLIRNHLQNIADWIAEAQQSGEINQGCEPLVQARILWATIEHGIQLYRILPDISLSDLTDCWYASIAGGEGSC